MYSLLSKHIDDQPLNPAIIFNGIAYNYQWLDEQTRRLVSFFIDQNKTTIACCSLNSPLSILSYLATSFLGVDYLPVNPRLKGAELVKIIQAFKPEFLFVEEGKLDGKKIEALENQGVQVIEIISIDYIDSPFYQLLQNLMPSSQQPSEEKTGRVYHLTSGAMGQNKFCEHDYQQVKNYAINRSKDMGFLQSDSALISLSLNHAFAFSYQLLPALAIGIPLHLHLYFDAESVVEAIQQGITSIALLPIMAYEVAKIAPPKASYSLRLPLVAGDALPQVIANRFEAVFSVPLYQGIGMTEVFGYAQNTPLHFNPQSAGKLFDQVHIKIANDQGDELPVGELGHVLLKNEATLHQYYLEPRLTNQKIQSGWIKTGDLGRIDSERFFYFAGRSQQIIIRGGSNISPVEVEAVLYQHPHVLEAAVVGKQSTLWGQVVWAFIVLDEKFQSSTQQDRIKSSIQVLCHQQLADYRHPEKIMIVDRLPKNATGKIDRFQLLNDANLA